MEPDELALLHPSKSGQRVPVAAAPLVGGAAGAGDQVDPLVIEEFAEFWKAFHAPFSAMWPAA